MRRHLMKGAGAKYLDDPKFLRYWWSGEDDAENSTSFHWWVDRIAKIGISCQSSVRKERGYYFPRTSMLNNANGGIWDQLKLGTHYRLVLNARVEYINNDIVLIDIGSYRDASNGGIMVSISNNKILSNHKRPNNISVKESQFPQDSFPVSNGDVLDGVFELGCEKYSDDDDILWFRFNGGEKIYANPYKSFVLNPLSPNDFNAFLNRGMNYYDPNKSQNILYRDIKIYVYD